MCRLDLVFEAGSKFQSKKLQAAICNAMLLEGTALIQGEEIHKRLFLWCLYAIRCKFDRALVSLYTLNKYFHKVLPIFIDAIQNAIFPKEAFEIVLQQKKHSFIINSEKVAFKARNAFFGSLFKNHPYGDSATLDDFDHITQDDIIDFHNKHYKNAAFKIYIAGMLPVNLQELLNKYLGTWSIKNKAEPGQYHALVKNEKSISLKRELYNLPLE